MMFPNPASVDPQMSRFGHRSFVYPWPKRILDAVASVLLLTLLLPLFLLIVLAIILDGLLVPRDRGPLLYSETRISRGRRFQLLKFRTLRRDVLRKTAGHARPHEADATNLTHAGRLFKRWYLDELPQLVNIIRGDMSFVGPRPWPPELVDVQVREGLDYRNRIVAGLTGPAQVTKGSVAARFASSDLEYVEALERHGGWGIAAYDLRLMLRTFRVLARSGGLSD